MQVKQLVLLNQLAHPFVGHLARAHSMGDVVRGNASPHVRPRMQVNQLFFLNQFSGGPPLRWSPGVRAQYGKRIEWQCIASCGGPECKWNNCLSQPVF